MLPAEFPGYIALALRIVGLGLERPWVRALSRAQAAPRGEASVSWVELPHSITACTLSFGLSLFVLLPVIVWQLVMGTETLALWAQWLPLAGASGLLYAVGFHSYVYALARGEVSYLTPLYATAFIWLYLLDLLFGGAALAPLPLFGILAVQLGIVLLNVNVHSAPGQPAMAAWVQALSPRALLRQPGALGMLAYAFCLATGRVIDKQVADIAPPVVYAFVVNVPAVLFGLLWLALRARLPELALLLRQRPIPAVGSAAVGIGAYVMLLLALDYFQPSIVEPLSQLSVFITVALGGLWFHEPVQTRWLPSALMVLGAVLLLI